MSHKIIRWVVVGLGKQGERMIEVIRRTPGHSVVGVVSKHRAASGNVFRSLKKALAETTSDAVYVCSPNHQHADHVEQALQAGKHVLCEKPFVLRVADARKLVRIARKKRLFLDTAFHLRERPVVQYVAAQIARQKLGSVCHVDMEWSVGSEKQHFTTLPKHQRWRTSLETAGGGALAARGVHLLDVFEVLVHEPIKRLAVMVDPPVSTKPDVTFLALVRSASVTGRLVTSRKMVFAENRVTITCTRGRLVVENMFELSARPRIHTYSQLGHRVHSTNDRDPYRAEMVSFGNRLHKHLPPAVNSVHATRVFEAVRQAIHTKREVVVRS